eukprot:14783617-Alexandrium_andersonii.AAC.1
MATSAPARLMLFGDVVHVVLRLFVARPGLKWPRGGKVCRGDCAEALEVLWHASPGAAAGA